MPLGTGTSWQPGGFTCIPTGGTVVFHRWGKLAVLDCKTLTSGQYFTNVPYMKEMTQVLA